MNLKKIKNYSNLIAILSSNLFIILAFYFSQDVKQGKSLNPDHKFILFPIENYLPRKEKGFAGLYDEFDNLIVKEVIIHPEEFEKSDFLLIEINEKDLKKIINFKGKKLRAFPTIEVPIKDLDESLEITF